MNPIPHDVRITVYVGQFHIDSVNTTIQCITEYQTHTDNVEGQNILLTSLVLHCSIML